MSRGAQRRLAAEQQSRELRLQRQPADPPQIPLAAALGERVEQRFGHLQLGARRPQQSVEPVPARGDERQRAPEPAALADERREAAQRAGSRPPPRAATAPCRRRSAATRTAPSRGRRTRSGTRSRRRAATTPRGGPRARGGCSSGRLTFARSVEAWADPAMLGDLAGLVLAAEPADTLPAHVLDGRADIPDQGRPARDALDDPLPRRDRAVRDLGRRPGRLSADPLGARRADPARPARDRAVRLAPAAAPRCRARCRSRSPACSCTPRSASSRSSGHTLQGDAWEGANRTLLYFLVFALFALWPQRGHRRFAAARRCGRWR